MKKLILIGALAVSFASWAQTEPVVKNAAEPVGALVQSQATAGADSMTFIVLQRDPEMDAMVDYYRKTYPPSITVHRGVNLNHWTDPSPAYTYYEIGGYRASENNVEEYLGEVAPISYKEFNRGREFRRKSAHWFYAGLGGFALMLTSNNRDIRRFGLGVLTVGTSISIGYGVAGLRKRRRGLNYYNTEFR